MQARKPAMIFKQTAQGNHLDLSCHYLSSSNIKTIFQFLNQHPEITSLDLTRCSLLNNKIGLDIAKALKENTTIRTLYLENNQIDDETAELLADIKTIRSLYLGNNHISDKGIKAFAKNTTITTLDLAGNDITDKGVEEFGANTTVTTLDLSFNLIRSLSAEVFKHNKNIICLNLFGCDIDNNGAKALAANSHITTLYLGILSTEAAEEFLKNDTLVFFHYMDRMIISRKVRDQLIQHIENNRNRYFQEQKSIIKNTLIENHFLIKDLANIVVEYANFTEEGDELCLDNEMDHAHRNRAGFFQPNEPLINAEDNTLYCHPAKFLL